MAEWVGNVIASASLLVAGLAFLKSHRTQQDANTLQRRIVEIEEERERDRLAVPTRAELRPELRNTGTHTYRLYLANDGSAEARNIRVALDNKPLVEHQAAAKNDTMPQFVGPDAEISCPLDLHQGCKPPFEIQLTWDDELGVGRSYRTTLTW